MGREIRLANREQRRALAKRDGGCIFPGCDCPVGWTDAHHVIWWEHDGPTDIWNLALLCRYHHGVTHRRGWTMTAAGDDWFTWTTPSGDTLHSQRHRGRSPTAHPAPDSPGLTTRRLTQHTDADRPRSPDPRSHRRVRTGGEDASYRRSDA